MNEQAGTCPGCGTRVAVRLEPGGLCPDCESAAAWTRYGAGGKLVIDAAALVEAERRRAGAAAGESPATRARRLLPGAVAAAAGGAGLVVALALLRPAGLAPLAEVRDTYGEQAHAALGLGLLAVVAGTVAVLVLRRSRLFRSWPLLLLNGLALACALFAVAVGGWSTLNPLEFRDIRGEPWRYLAMPRLDAGPGAAPLARRVMEATTVILAPDAEGDMRGMAIGSGAVISRAERCAWVLTNSHVAMPYVAAASFREPRHARPVLVYFSDGRYAPGRVVWAAQPPLDAVVLAVDIDEPPAPVPVAPDAEDVAAGDAVFFVPNPFRHGWLSQTGRVTDRRAQPTPVGTFSLLYTDLPAEPGDSGTGLFDGRGRLVGINTWARFDADFRGLPVPKGISLPARVLGEITDLIASRSLIRLEDR